MIKSVGIGLAGTGEHKVCCLDERAQMCDGFGFQATPEGLVKLEKRIFGDGSNPVNVFEPIGLTFGHLSRFSPNMLLKRFILCWNCCY